MKTKIIILISILSIPTIGHSQGYTGDYFRARNYIKAPMYFEGTDTLATKAYVRTFPFILGSGTTNYVPYFTSSNTLSTSPIYISSGNVGIGTATLPYKLTVDGNIGSSNMETNSTSQTTRLGINSGLNENETGVRLNVFIGYESGYSNTKGNNNVFLGSYSGYSNTTGHENVFIGSHSGYSNTIGYDNTTGHENVFLGSHSGYSNTTGYDNILIGAYTRYYKKSSNYELVIDAIKRGSSYLDSTIYQKQSLIYGKFDNDTLNQELDVNGRLRYTGTFAEIYRHKDSTAYTQIVPTGSTPTKITAFSDDKYSVNCTADAANDNITITSQGYYKIDIYLSYQLGTSGVTFEAYLFQNGTATDNIGSIGKPANSNDPMSTALGGLIHVTSVPCDIDFRVTHDNVGSIDLTFQHLNMVATYIGE